jgi:hypothetical protein
MLSASGGLLLSENNYAVIGAIIRQRRGLGAGAVKAVEEQDPPTEVVGVEMPFFSGKNHQA